MWLEIGKYFLFGKVAENGSQIGKCFLFWILFPIRKVVLLECCSSPFNGDGGNCLHLACRMSSRFALPFLWLGGV